MDQLYDYDNKPILSEIKPPTVKAEKRLTPQGRKFRPAYREGKAARNEGIYRNRNPTSTVFDSAPGETSTSPRLCTKSFETGGLRPVSVN